MKNGPSFLLFKLLENQRPVPVQLISFILYLIISKK
jgi:hypothetical protein